ELCLHRTGSSIDHTPKSGGHLAVESLYRRLQGLAIFPPVAVRARTRHDAGADMSTDNSGAQERRHTAEIFRDNWLWLVLLGTVLVLAGAAAILVPAVSEIPASKILGSVLVVSGIIQIIQSAKMLHWIGFIWHMLLGILATVGGALIYMDPFAGVVALTLLI